MPDAKISWATAENDIIREHFPPHTPGVCMDTSPKMWRQTHQAFGERGKVCCFPAFHCNSCLSSVIFFFFLVILLSSLSLFLLSKKMADKALGFSSLITVPILHHIAGSNCPISLSESSLMASKAAQLPDVTSSSSFASSFPLHFTLLLVSLQHNPF